MSVEPVRVDAEGARASGREAIAAALRRRWSRFTAITLVGAAAVVAMLSLAAASRPYAQLGSSDPGLVVRLLDPLTRLVVDAAATVSVGSLVFAAFFTKPRPDGLMAPSAYAALSTAARAAGIWAAAALVMVPLDAADESGLPLGRVLAPTALATVIGVLEAPRAWLLVAALATAVWIGALRGLRGSTPLLLCGLSMLAALPPLLVGHSASDAGHDLSTAALVIHAPAAMIWLGTLLAVLRARGPGTSEPAVLYRYGRLSAGCAVAVAASGLVDATVLAPDPTAWRSPYGILLLAKVALVVAFGLIVLVLRRRSSSVSPTRFILSELVLLAAGFALSVGLTHLAAPKFVGRSVTGTETLIGYGLAGPPTVGRLVADWRVDLVLAPLSVAMAVVYLLGVARIRRAGVSWPPGRTAWWLGGCAVLLVASSSGVGRYAAAMFSQEALAHMLIGMLGPVGLAMGGPLTLVRASSWRASTANLPGAEDLLATVGSYSGVRALVHPVVAGVVFAGAPFAFFFSPAFDLSVRYHWAHAVADIVFLIIGYAFAWVMVGADPLPRPVSPLVRIGVLVAVMPTCVGFAAAILASGRVLGNGALSANLYSALALPWVPDLRADQRMGAYLALATSECVLMLILVVIAVRWVRSVDDSADDDLHGLLGEVHRQRSAVGMETAQPQTVEDDEQRRYRHGRARDQRVQQPRHGDG